MTAAERLARLHQRFADDLVALAESMSDDPELRGCIYEQAALSRDLADELLAEQG